MSTPPPSSPFALSGVKLLIVFILGAVLGAISVVQLVPNSQLVGNGPVAFSPQPTTSGAPGPTPSGSVGPSGASPVPTQSGGGSVPPGDPELACAPGRNGGATDEGVTGTQINMATTVVQSGFGAAFLGDVQYAMEAVKNKVNRDGGICGRLLNIRYVDDGWDASRGSQYLRNFIAGDPDPIFTIPVAPSSEGLRIVIDSGDIKKAGIPVVGTDGMLIDQYTDPWVWSVAASTASSARIMARNAAARGAKSFSIVFDKNYRFGVEAAAAFNSEVKRLTGDDIPGFNSANNCQESFCGIEANRSSYDTFQQGFRPGDYMAMFVEPATGLTWMNGTRSPVVSGNQAPSQSHPRVPNGIGAAQPLFTADFANQCKANCDGIWVWTSYKPYIEAYKNDPAVKTYVDDLNKTKPDADEYNAFAVGGYVGMQLIVEALKAIGPQLTRERMLAALDSIDFHSGLTIQDPLQWRPGNHYAAATMQGFEIQYKGSFSGWRTKDIERDPSPQRGAA
jgi:ABC-type branched-subunit amino acid transport system substrate-binding protein